MYRLGLSVAHSDRAAALIKGQTPVKIVCEKTESDDDDPLPSALIQNLLRSQGVNPSEIECVSIVAPWRSPEVEEGPFQGWLLPIKNWGRRLHQNWTFGAEIKDWLEEHFGVHPQVSFVSEDKCRAAFGLRRFSNEDAFVLNLHSRRGEMGTTIWRVGPGTMQPLVAFEQDESFEFFLNNLAHFCGFSGPKAIQNFLSLAEMGEPSYINRLIENVLSLDSDGKLDLEEDELEEFPTLESSFESLTRWFGPARRDANLPITVRELDLAASALTLLRMHIQRLGGKLRKEQGALPLILQSESQLGEVFAQEFDALRIFPRVQWMQEKESVSEALGAVYAELGEVLHWKFEPMGLQNLNYTQLFHEG